MKALIVVCVVVFALLATATELTYQTLDVPQTPLAAVTISPAPTPSPSPSASPTPTPTQKPSPPPLTGSFGPLGGFRIVSPTNTVYNSSKLKLEISGQAIAAGLSMSYSLDGYERVSIPAQVRQAHDWDPFFGVIHESVALPPLASGYHSITVYGRLMVNDCLEAQTTVYFTVA